MFLLRSRSRMPAFRTTDDAYDLAQRTTTVADCLARGWSVILQCTDCRRAAEFPAERLSSLPARLTMAALAKAAKCSCGNVGAWVDHRSANPPPVGTGLKEVRSAAES
jgi:hypothetical protein